MDSQHMGNSSPTLHEDVFVNGNIEFTNTGNARSNYKRVQSEYHLDEE